MSEPNSFYMRVHIEKNAFWAFLNSPIKSMDFYEDWMPWLHTCEFYGRINEDKIHQMTMTAKTVKEYLDPWIFSKYNMGYSHYDDQKEEWVVSILQFSENYLEYVQFLHVLRGVALYRKQEKRDDFALILPFLFGDSMDSDLLAFKKESSVFLKKIPENYQLQAIEHLNERYELLMGQYEAL